MGNEYLFTPSLKEDDEKISTYDINKFFYVAFFGGVIPLVGLATITAKKFKIEKRTIAFLAAAGILLLLAKYYIVFTIYNHQPIMDDRILSWMYKGASCLLYLAYYKIMKEKFTIHVSYGGEVKPIFSHALAWVFVGALVEVGLGIFVAWVTGTL